MTAPGSQTAHRFRAHSRAIRRARETALQFAREHEVPARRLGDIALAVSEATSNVVLHAYRRERLAGTFSLGLEVDDGSLRIDVRDDGLGMGPRIDSPGLGLGLPIIASVADALLVTPRRSGGTCVSMRFDLDG